MPELVRIARGSFATAYLERGGEGRVFCVTDHPGHGKEVLARAAGRLGGNPHLPAVSRYAVLPAEDSLPEREVWVAPYYRPLVRVEAPKAWAVFEQLRRCHCDAVELLGNDEIGSLLCHQTLSYARVRLGPGLLLEALGALVREAALVSHEYRFEIAPRNVAADAEGHLVLLDILFEEAEFTKLSRRDLYRRDGNRRVRSHARAMPKRIVLL